MEDNIILNEDSENGVEDLGVTVNDDVDEVAIAEKVPDLSSAEFALRGSLKLMDGKYGGSFNVRYLQDDVKKYGWLELLIAYPDSTVKSVYLFKNAFRETDTSSSGVYVPSETHKPTKGFRSWDDDDCSECDFAFAKYYEAPNMPIPARVLWDRIREHYSEIPIVKIHSVGRLETVYFQMAKLAAEYSKGIGLSFMDSDESFSVTSKDFKNIAVRNGWEPQALKVEFDKAELFIKDKTGGYQKSKKVHGRHVHYYVLRKQLLDNTQGVKSVENTEYQSGEKNQLEKMKDYYEKQLDTLRKEIERAAKEKRPPRPEDTLL